ncbi:hypothetical protein [Streptomyces aidingensis]|uniref:Uncharacterized protein n=1 Tax=Streptomyces aidingensis TaxID=910347 RepID=A0A1I1PXP4_9ACTN|nr:hypothetical protein [Streptomyces aidingensis]SFD12378.1 hypothetical protein SAMN05421773_1107 [Streptomyces aidingensis]
MSTSPGPEQRSAAAAEMRARLHQVKKKRRKPQPGRGWCPGGGVTVMATKDGPVSIPCLCCGGGAD